MTPTTNAPSYLSDVTPELVDILGSGEDDTPRLIYADWLQDHGEPERAEFIRVQVELHGPRRQWEAIQREGCKACHNRKLVLSRGAGGQMMPGPCGRCDDLEYYVYSRVEKEADFLRWLCREDYSGPLGLPNHETMEVVSEGLIVFGLDMELKFRRGFIAEVHAPLAVLEKHLPALVREHPIERVRAVDKEPIRYGAETDLWPEHWTWWIDTGLTEPDDIHDPLAHHLITDMPSFGDGGRGRNYPTAEAAREALSRALLGLAKL